MQLDAKKKKALMAGGAGVVVVAALVARSRGAAGAGNASDPTASTVADSAMLPSTFADNGAGFGELSSALSNGLGNVATSNDALAGAVTAGNQTVTDAVAAGVAAGIAQGRDGAEAAPNQAPPGRAPAGRPAKPKPKHPKPKPKAKPKHPKPKPKPKAKHPKPKPKPKHHNPPRARARARHGGRPGRGAHAL